MVVGAFSSLDAFVDNTVCGVHCLVDHEKVALTMYTPFGLYQDYISLKAHFSREKYNFFRNKPHRVTLKSFEKRKDIWVFEKLCHHSNPLGLMIANLIYEEKMWPEFLIREEAERNCIERTKRIQSLRYMFTEDLKKLLPNFDSNILVKDNSIPPLLKFLIQGKVSIETVCIVCDVSNCFGHWNKQLKGDMLWEGMKLKIIKYKPFLVYDRDAYRKLMVSVFNERNDDVV